MADLSSVSRPRLVRNCGHSASLIAVTIEEQSLIAIEVSKKELKNY